MSQPWAAAKIYAGSKPKGATVKKSNSSPPPFIKRIKSQKSYKHGEKGSTTDEKSIKNVEL